MLEARGVAQPAQPRGRDDDKKSPAGYERMLDKDIPVVKLADGLACVRVIAGHFRGIRARRARWASTCVGPDSKERR